MLFLEETLEYYTFNFLIFSFSFFPVFLSFCLSFFLSFSLSSSSLDITGWRQQFSASQLQREGRALSTPRAEWQHSGYRQHRNCCTILVCVGGTSLCAAAEGWRFRSELPVVLHGVGWCNQGAESSFLSLFCSPSRCVTCAPAILLSRCYLCSRQRSRDAVLPITAVYKVGNGT